jgi:hypothetical protein
MKNGWHQAFKSPLGSMAVNVLIQYITASCKTEAESVSVHKGLKGATR